MVSRFVASRNVLSAQIDAADVALSGAAGHNVGACFGRLYASLSIRNAVSTALEVPLK